MPGREIENIKSFFDSITDFLFILDLEGNIIETNKAVLSILGYSKEDIYGKSVLLVHPPEVRDEAMQIVGDMIAGIRESCPLPLLAKDNRHIPVETKVFPGVWKSEKVLIGLSRNLSELALSEGKFREVFNNNLALMSISDLDTGNIVDVNKQFLKTLGYTAAEVIGSNSKDLNIYEDYNQRVEVWKQLQNIDRVEDIHSVIRTKTGEPIHCLVSVSKVQIQTHKFAIVTANNITKIKIAEEKLKHSLKNQTLLADVANGLNSVQDIGRKLDETLWILGRHTNVSRVYIFEDDPGGNTTSNTYEWCNKGIEPQKDSLQNLPNKLIPSWKRLLDGNGKIQCNNIRDLPDDLVAALEPQGVRSLLAFPLYAQEKYIGSVGFDECSTNKQWEADEVELLRAVANIISNAIERVRIQKQLSYSEARLKMAIENTETGLWDWNIPTGEVYYSDTWCRMIGYEKSEIEPSVTTWERLVHPDDMPAINEALEAHMSGKTEIYQTTHRVLTKSGEYKWIIDKGKIIERDKEGKPVRAIGTHTDIDHLKKIESELRIANATKDKFLSIIAHDLRGPIGAIAQVAELLSEKGNVDEDTMYAFLNSQKEMSKNTYQLLDNLLSWANYNRDQFEYKPALLSLNTVINENIENLKFQSNHKNIHISADFKEQYSAYADEDMIKLVVRNLLTNAIKFTPLNGSVKVSMKNLKDVVRISITDTGVGISKENLEKILSDDKYYSTFGTEKEKGTGLGLKLCKNFVEINNGALSVKSIVGKGTTFSFTLPKGY